jgi:lipopolysaccharide/colanic/teichoic acid biosynthesis glycosyltransferase
MVRLRDVLIAFTAIIALFPVIVGISLAVFILMGKPVFFKQPRPGLHGAVFTLYKFRTMTEAKDSHGSFLGDEARLTKFGQWLRSTSLDELPSLWNVLKGEMSLVGPRPLLIEYLELYSPNQARRHDVRPGLTGWAQVNGRNAISWDEKFAFDVWYVDNRTLWLDMQIIWLTLRKVVARDGINAVGEVTMPRFTGAAAKPGDGA